MEWFLSELTFHVCAKWFKWWCIAGPIVEIFRSGRDSNQCICIACVLQTILSGHTKGIRTFHLRINDYSLSQITQTVDIRQSELSQLYFRRRISSWTSQHPVTRIWEGQKWPWVNCPNIIFGGAP